MSRLRKPQLFQPKVQEKEAREFSINPSSEALSLSWTPRARVAQMVAQRGHCAAEAFRASPKSYNLPERPSRLFLGVLVSSDWVGCLAVSSIPSSIWVAGPSSLRDNCCKGIPGRLHLYAFLVALEELWLIAAVVYTLVIC